MLGRKRISQLTNHNTQPIMTQLLKGKRVLVTAAAAGIGKAIAEEADANGAVVMATDIDETNLSQIQGDHISTQFLDVTDHDAVSHLINTSEPFDCIANVAGYVHHGNLLNCTREEWRKSFTINVDSMFNVMQASVPKMIANGGGSIISIASVVSSLKGLPDRFAYGTTKAAILGMTKSIARDFLEDNIRCNVICPGTVDTPSWRARCEELGGTMGSYEKAREYFELRQPMKRLASPSEIAGLAIFLLSDRASYITGQFHLVDGGIMI